MKIGKKVLSVLLLAALAVTMFAGCKSGSDTPPPANDANQNTQAQAPAAPADAPADSAPAPADAAKEHDPVTLRFSWWGTDARHEATLAVIDAFMAKYPYITIEPEYGAQTGYNDKKTTEFANHTAPDIFQVETGAGIEYYRMGVLYNLSTIPTISFDKFDPAFLESNGQFGSGSQYCIPTGAAGSAIIVNKTLADKIGIDFTKQYDWEQFIPWGAQVQAYDPDSYLLSINTTAGVGFFVRAYARQMLGVPIIDDETKTLNMTEAQFTQMFDLIDRLYKTKTAAPAAMKDPYKDSKDQEDPNWINGKYVASVGFGSNAQVLKEANPSVDYIAGKMPLLPDRKSDGWTNNTPQYMGVYAETKHPEEAGLFYDFFFNSEEAVTLLGTVRSIPPTAFAQEIVKANGSADPLVVEAVDMSLTYKGFDDQGYTTSAEMLDLYNTVYDSVAFGLRTPAQAAKDIVAQIEEFLARQ